MEIKLEGNSLTIRENGKPAIVEPSADIIAFLGRLTEVGEKTAIGYISYEAMSSLPGLDCSTATSPIPEALFYIYDSVIKYDHTTGQYHPALLQTEFGIDQNSSSAPDTSPAKLTNQMAHDEYLSNNVMRPVCLITECPFSIVLRNTISNIIVPAPSLLSQLKTSKQSQNKPVFKTGDTLPGFLKTNHGTETGHKSVCDGSCSESVAVGAVDNLADAQDQFE